MVLLRMLSVPIFNVLKFLFCSYLLTWASSCFSNSLERLRRAYCLRHYGKVRIGGPTNSLIRCLGITTSPHALALNVTAVIVLFAIEFVVEMEGTDSVRIGVPRYGKVKLRQIEPFNVSSWSEERGVFKKDFVHCSFQNRTHILIWPTELVEENGFPRLLCPRNTTTQYLSDNESKARVTRIEDFGQEMIPLKSAFNNRVDDEHDDNERELSHVAYITIPQPVREKDLGNFVGKFGKERHYLYEFLSRIGSDKLICVGRRYAFLDQPDVSSEDLFGCMFKAQSKGRFVLYHVISPGITKLRFVDLTPVAVISEMTQALLIEVLQRSFDEQGVRRRWPRLIGAIITKMAEEGRLKVRPAKYVKRIVKIESGIRPVVDIWVLVLIPFLLFMLACTVGFVRRYATRLFPFREIVGEDNMIRVWAREQRQGLRADPTEPSWLVLEDDGDGMRLKAFIDEPGSRLLNRKARIRGLM